MSGYHIVAKGSLRVIYEKFSLFLRTQVLPSPHKGLELFHCSRVSARKRLVIRVEKGIELLQSRKLVGIHDMPLSQMQR